MKTAHRAAQQQPNNVNINAAAITIISQSSGPRPAERRGELAGECIIEGGNGDGDGDGEGDASGDGIAMAVAPGWWPAVDTCAREGGASDWRPRSNCGTSCLVRVVAATTTLACAAQPDLGNVYGSGI